MWGYPVTLLKTDSPGETQRFVLKPELFQRKVCTWWLQNSLCKQKILLQITDHQQGLTHRGISVFTGYREFPQEPERGRKGVRLRSPDSMTGKDHSLLTGGCMSLFQYAHKTWGTIKQTSCPRHQNVTRQTNEGLAVRVSPPDVSRRDVAPRGCHARAASALCPRWRTAVVWANLSQQDCLTPT